MNTKDAIDLAEAAYDVSASPAEWLPKVLEAGNRLLDWFQLRIAGVTATTARHRSDFFEGS